MLQLSNRIFFVWQIIKLLNLMTIYISIMQLKHDLNGFDKNCTLLHATEQINNSNSFMCNLRHLWQIIDFRRNLLYSHRSINKTPTCIKILRKNGNIGDCAPKIRKLFISMCKCFGYCFQSKSRLGWVFIENLNMNVLNFAVNKTG